MFSETTIALGSYLAENAEGPLRADILNEAGLAEDLTAAMLDKMLDMTVGKAQKLKFGDIEYSRGDVENCRFYKNLKESIDILCDIDESTHKIPNATIVSAALNNMRLCKKEFTEGFRTKNRIAILLYDTMYYSIIEATSYLIATSIQFVKGNGKIEIQASDSNSKEMTLIKNLAQFNEVVVKGDIKKFIHLSAEIETELDKVDDTKPMNEGVGASTIDGAKGAAKIFSKIKNLIWKGGGLTKTGKWVIGIASVSAFLYIAINIIPLIKSCVYLFYKFKHSISESCKVQADLIEMNIARLKSIGADEKVIEREEKHAARFNSMANTFAISVDKAVSEAKHDEMTDRIDPNTLVI